MITSTRKLVVAAAAVAALTAMTSLKEPGTKDPGDVTVHEWGTFTSIAGTDGRAVSWLPLGGPSDLPGFVHRASNLPPKTTLAATVRMETPVLYFYSSRDVRVNVNVRFRQGVITEHFPRGIVGPAGVDVDSLNRPGFEGRIVWRDVSIQPDAEAAFATEQTPNHYYAARGAGAAPLRVGAEREGFLFYRGIANLDLPVIATVGADGEVDVTNAGDERLPALVLFVNRGGWIGYEVRAAGLRRTRFAPPDMDGNPESLRSAVEQLLVGEGLYPKEAAAMVATWRDSWFEEGTRLFYVVPRRMVDAVLPLEIQPAPATVARVFVGRVELVTADTLTDLEGALRTNDRARLARLGRFLRPFGDRLIARSAPAERQRLEGLLTTAVLQMQGGTIRR